MTRLLEWLVRRMGGMTLVILGLLSFCLAGLIWGLSTIVRGLDLDLLLVVTIVGAVSGWLLARSRVHPLLALLCAILIALVAAFVRVGQLGGRLLALMGAAAETLWDAQFRRFYPQKVLEPLESLFGAILTLVTRLQGWSQGLVSGQSVYEPVALALLWSFVVCLVAAWARLENKAHERAFDAVLPLVFLLALVTAYAGHDILILCLVLGAWFGLLVAVLHLAHERRWEKDAVPFAEGLGFDLALIAVPVIVVTLTLAVVVPVVSPQEIPRWVRPLNESAPTSSEVILNSFGIEPAPRPSTALDGPSFARASAQSSVGCRPGAVGKISAVRSN